MRVLRGVVYMTKSSGPRTEPWETPQEEVCQEDRSVSHFTRKQRDDRYDLNQLRTECVEYKFSFFVHVVSADSVNCFKNRLDKFWSNQEVLYNHKADLPFTFSFLPIV